MKKLSEYTDEKAFELLGDLLEPAGDIFADPKLVETYKANKNKMAIAKFIFKNHAKEAKHILAILNEESPETFTCNPASVLTDLIELLNDEDLLHFFTSQVDLVQDESSISAKATTTE